MRFASLPLTALAVLAVGSSSALASAVPGRAGAGAGAGAQRLDRRAEALAPAGDIELERKGAAYGIVSKRATAA